LRVSDFSKEDLVKVAKEKRCIYSCMARVEQAMSLGDYQEAKQSLVDALNSIDSIEVLRWKAQMLEGRRKSS